MRYYCTRTPSKSRVIQNMISAVGKGPYQFCFKTVFSGYPVVRFTDYWHLKACYRTLLPGFVFGYSDIRMFYIRTISANSSTFRGVAFMASQFRRRIFEADIFPPGCSNEEYMCHPTVRIFEYSVHRLLKPGILIFCCLNSGYTDNRLSRPESYEPVQPDNRHLAGIC